MKWNYSIIWHTVTHSGSKFLWAVEFTWTACVSVLHFLKQGWPTCSQWETICPSSCSGPNPEDWWRETHKEAHVLSQKDSGVHCYLLYRRMPATSKVASKPVLFWGWTAYTLCKHVGRGTAQATKPLKPVLCQETASLLPYVGGSRREREKSPEYFYIHMHFSP